MTTPVLPPVDDDRVDAMERTVFARIAADRAIARRRRTRTWAWAGSAAAVLVVAAVIAPAVTAGVSGTRTASQPVVAIPGVLAPDGVESAPDLGERLDGMPASGGAADSGATESATADASSGRDIVANGSATIEVADVADAVRRVGEAATGVGGYVESSQVGSGNVVTFDGSVPMPSDPTSGWVSVRVPAETLSSVMDGLGEIGTVVDSSVSRSDVTDQAVDLRARVATAEASVARLTELIGQAASVADLITAESALSERQAQLDADRRQLELLESQVAMSSLSVQVRAERENVQADPTGFGDGLVAGWNGLVATVNGIVIALGFLLPWIVLVGAGVAIVWVIRRSVRRRGSRQDDTVD